MSIDYSICGKWAAEVRAVAITESNEDPSTVGDGGQARSLFQWHPAAFAESYGMAHLFPRAVDDTWLDADMKALAGFFEVWVGSRSMELGKAVMCFHLGRAAVMNEGKWDGPYLAKFNLALAKVRAGNA